MRFILMLLIFPLLIFAQKTKKLDVVSNIEVRGILMKPIGNNTFAKDLDLFAGYGFGGNLMTPIHWGIGVDYNKMFSNVKYSHEERYGYLGPKADNLDVYLTHRDQLSNDFFVEELLGYSYFSIKNEEMAGGGFQKQVAHGINIGGRFLYNLDRNGYQQFTLTAKAHSFSSKDRTSEYYNKAFLLALSFAYRYNF